MNIKISTSIDEKVWEELKSLAKESRQSISGLLTDAVKDYLRKKRIRPEFLKHMEDSCKDHDDLYRLLAK
jgi:predicted CopG family antitoxin